MDTVIGNAPRLLPMLSHNTPLLNPYTGTGTNVYTMKWPALGLTLSAEFYWKAMADCSRWHYIITPLPLLHIPLPFPSPARQDLIPGQMLLVHLVPSFSIACS